MTYPDWDSWEGSYEDWERAIEDWYAYGDYTMSRYEDEREEEMLNDNNRRS